MRKLTALAIVLSGSAFAAPAMAQDTTPSDYFNGFYIQGAAGLDQIDGDSNDTLVFDTNGDGAFNNNVNTTTGANAFSPGFCGGNANGPRAAQGCTDDNNDVGYAVRIGADSRLGGDSPFVVGFLVEGARSESQDFTTGFSTTPASYTVARKLENAVSARGRLGYSPGDGRGLFYVTGGASYGEIEREFTTSNTANAFTPNDDSDWQWGWQAGAGAELMLTRNISVGLEYLFSRYEDDDYSVRVSQGTAPATNPFLIGGAGQTDLRTANSDLDIHALRGTIGFHF